MEANEAELSLAVPAAGLAAAVAVIMAEGIFGLWDLAVGLTLLAILLPSVTRGRNYHYSAAAVVGLSSMLIAGFVLDIAFPAAGRLSVEGRPQLNVRAGVAFAAWAAVTWVVGRILKRRRFQ